MAITQLDCFRATVAHEPHEGLLFYCSFTPDLKRRVFEREGIAEGEDFRERFGMYAPAHVALKAPEGRAAPDFSRYFEGEEIPEGAKINSLGVLEIPGSMYHFTHYVSPLRNAQTFDEIVDFPYVSAEGCTSDHMAGIVEEAHARGRIAVGVIGHMYENAWQVRGYTEFLMDMVDRPEFCEHILDRYMEEKLAAAVAAAEAGADMLHCGDDVANQNAMMFSLDQWRRFMRSRWEKVWSAARAVKPDIQIWYHSDGNITDIVPELIEAGVTVLNPVQPECVDPVALKRQYGDRIVFDGTIGTQSTMPWGTPDDVRRVVRENVAALGQDGAFIVSPTHVLEPEVPIDNIMAFLETCREFGEVT